MAPGHRVLIHRIGDVAEAHALLTTGGVGCRNSCTPSLHTSVVASSTNLTILANSVALALYLSLNICNTCIDTTNCIPEAVYTLQN